MQLREIEKRRTRKVRKKKEKRWMAGKRGVLVAIRRCDGTVRGMMRRDNGAIGRRESTR